MWAVFEKKDAIKSIKKVPKPIVRRYEFWKRLLETEGPQGLKVIKGFRDEALKGKWQGCRASRLGIQWRVIYKVEGKMLEVYVIEVTPHKY